MSDNNKAVLVTGAARGIGAAIARRAAADGFDIAINDVANEPDAQAVAAECRALGVRADVWMADVTDWAQCEAMVKSVAERFGGVWGLVNNAGITKDALLLRMTEEQFDRVLNVNLKSVFNLSKLASAHMIRARGGRIVSVSSVVGVYGNAGQCNYAASKAAIIGFTKSLAKEIGSRGVTVNAVAPGYIKTAMTDALPDEARAALTRSIALGRLGEPEDIAKAVAFFLSPDSGYITAQVLQIDGGISV